MFLRRPTPALVAGTVLAGLLATPWSAAAAPDQELPFPCAEEWTGSTRSDHRPSRQAVDFNRSGDLGQIVVASAPGVVSRVADTGATSYGKWVRIDHAEDYSTVYAHLLVQWVVPGQFVDQGTPLGRVGDSGGVTAAHLHYEQRLGDDVVAPMFHQLPYAFGTATVSQNCPDVPLAGDWNGDRVEEVAVFRRDAGKGTFELYAQDAPPTTVRFARGSDLPVTGDWDGDGRTDIGVRRQSRRAFLLRRADGTLTRLRLGRAKDLPVTGDWDGDGATDLGIFRPAARRFRLVGPDGSLNVFRLGTTTSLPVAGDWDGDGRTEVGVYDAASATFTLRMVDSAGQVARVPVTAGAVGDLPVTGDWDGDGVTDVGTWSPATATYTLQVTPRATPAASSRWSSGAEPEVRTLTFGRPR